MAVDNTILQIFNNDIWILDGLCNVTNVSLVLFSPNNKGYPPQKETQFQ